MSSDKWVQFFDRVADLFEKHGVYAVLAVLIFFIWYYISRRLEKTTNKELRAYYEKIHTRALWATFVAMILVSAVWFYANFLFSQTYIKGAIYGLRNYNVEPKRSAPEPLVVEGIDARSPSFDLYSRILPPSNDAEAIKEGQYDVKEITHTNMGYVLRHLNRDDEAIQNYRAAIALYPQDYVPFDNLAYLYAERTWTRRSPTLTGPWPWSRTTPR